MPLTAYYSEAYIGGDFVYDIYVEHMCTVLITSAILSVSLSQVRELRGGILYKIVM